MFFSKKKGQGEPKPESAVIPIQWGGYYAYHDEKGQYGFFRLLDFNKSAYHSQLFQEKFSHLPSLQELVRLRPFIGHAPIAVGGLLRDQTLTLIGGEPLTTPALEGYKVYLSEMGWDDKEMAELIARIIQFSQEGPMPIRLTREGDQTLVSPAD